MEKTRNESLICVGVLSILLPTNYLFLSTGLFIIPVFAGIVCILVGCCKMTESAQRWMTIISLVFCGLADTAPFVLAWYGDRSGYPIKIVLPVGYQGEFSIVKDKIHGEDVTLNENDWWVYQIPASGVLRVKDDSPFYIWHGGTVVDKQGNPVAVEDLGTQLGQISTGPNSSKASTDYDGTTHRWRVLPSSKKVSR